MLARSSFHLALALVFAVEIAACAAAPPSTLTAADRAEIEGFERRGVFWIREASLHGMAFLEVIAGTDAVDSELPLVLALHGYGDTPRTPEAPYLDRARPFRMVIPRGPYTVTGGFAWSTTRVRDEQPELLARDLTDRVEVLAQFLPHLREARPTRGSTIVVGFSQGGILTLALTVAHPELVGVSLPMAAWLPPTLEPVRAPSEPRRALPPIRSIHGVADERVPYPPTAELFARLREVGWDATLETHEGGHTVAPEVEAFVARELDQALIARDR